MSMFNECVIHLCDCTCLNMLHMLNYMLIKHKNIFECFSCFWKVLFILKNVKNFKNCATLSGDLPRGSSQSHAPVTSFYQRFSRLIGRSKSQLRKRLRNFSKIWVFRFLATLFGDLFANGSSSCEVYTKCFVTPS